VGPVAGEELHDAEGHAEGELDPAVLLLVELEFVNDVVGGGVDGHPVHVVDDRRQEQESDDAPAPAGDARGGRGGKITHDGGGSGEGRREASGAIVSDPDGGCPGENGYSKPVAFCRGPSAWTARRPWSA